MTARGDGTTTFKVDNANEEDDALASLQNEIQRIKNDRDEERFILVIVIIILIDALIFSQMANWAGALVIGVIEIFGIAVLARRWRIEEIPQILSKFLDRTAEKVNPPAASSPSNGETPSQP